MILNLGRRVEKVIYALMIAWIALNTIIGNFMVATVMLERFAVSVHKPAQVSFTIRSKLKTGELELVSTSSGFSCGTSWSKVFPNYDVSVESYDCEVIQ